MFLLDLYNDFKSKILNSQFHDVTLLKLLQLYWYRDMEYSIGTYLKETLYVLLINKKNYEINYYFSYNTYPWTINSYICTEKKQFVGLNENSSSTKLLVPNDMVITFEDVEMITQKW